MAFPGEVMVCTSSDLLMRTQARLSHGTYLKWPGLGDLASHQDGATPSFHQHDVRKSEFAQSSHDDTSHPSILFPRIQLISVTSDLTRIHSSAYPSFPALTVYPRDGT
jgi:hypothetical protein